MGFLFCILNRIVLWVVIFSYVTVSGAPLASSADVIRIDEVQLQRRAEAEGVGYKTANLEQLRSVCEVMSNIQVPAFVGITSSKIQDLLRDSGFNARDKWAVVLDKADTSRSLGELAPDFIDACRYFAQELTAVWNTLSDNPSLDELFGVEGLDTFLAGVAARGGRVMVRSTGKEDKVGLANAGGNESIANVEPTTKAVLEAMGRVIASYSSEKSLKQRFAAGDESVLTEHIFTPVLIQEMIGEVDGEAVPACGVMFTEDPAGGISMRAGAAGGLQSTGIVLINAAWGHNTGVVNSLVPADTYRCVSVSAERVMIYPVVRRKTKRLKPGSSGKLNEVSNDLSLSEKPALTRDQLERLTQFAGTLEQFYQRAIDIEFVVKGETIYIVQARPLTYSKDPVKPSYIEPSAYEDLAAYSVQTICSASNSVSVLETGEELLVARDIGTALDRYLSAGFNKSAVKVVLVGRDAPSTSHEATTFRSEGKTVFFSRRFQEIADALRKGTLYASPQQGVILSTKQAERSATSSAGVAEFKESFAQDTIVRGIREGWCGYPAPREISVFGELLGGAPDEIKTADIIVERSSAKAILAELATATPGRTDELVIAMAGLVRRLLDPSRALDKRKSGHLRRLIIQVLGEVKRLADIEPSSDLYITRLLPLKMLEALIFQQGDQICLPLSVAKIIKMQKDEKATADRLKELAPKDAVAPLKSPLRSTSPVYAVSRESGEMVVQLGKVSELAYTEDVGKAWNDFVRRITLHGDVSLLGSLTRFIGTLAQFGVLPLWLNTDFALEDSPSPEMINTWISELRRDDEIFTQITVQRARVNSYDREAFADMTKTATLWEAYKRDVVNTFNTPEFIDRFKASGKLSKIAAAGLMREFVEQFDEIIKTYKGIPAAQLSNEDKLPIFQDMLKSFWMILDSWVQLLQPPDVFDLVDDTVIMLGNIVAKDSPVVDDLMPTPGVDCPVFALGSGHQWKHDADTNKQPASLEDAYTITHQSLMNILSNISLTGSGATVLPKLMARIEDILTTSFPDLEIEGARVTGIRSDASKLSKYYNLSLNQHGCQIEATYNKLKRAADVTLKFAGGYKEERHRWAEIAILSYLKNKQGEGVYDVDYLADHSVWIKCFVQDADVEAFAALWKDLLQVSLSFKINRGRKYSCTVEDLREIQTFFNEFGEVGLLSTMIGYFWVVGSSTKEEIAAFVDVMMPVAHELFLTGTDSFRAYDFFILFIEHEIGFAKLVEIAEAAMDSDKAYVRRATLNLFKALVRKNQGYTQAIQAGNKALSFNDKDLLDTAIMLFEVLVKKGQGYADAIKAARTCFRYGLHYLALKAVDVFKALIEKEQGYDEIIMIAKENVTSIDNLIRRLSYTLFKELVKKGQGCLEAIEAAESGIRSPLTFVQSQALSLFEALKSAAPADYQPAVIDAIREAIAASSVVAITDQLRVLLLSV